MTSQDTPDTERDDEPREEPQEQEQESSDQQQEGQENATEGGSEEQSEPKPEAIKKPKAKKPKAKDDAQARKLAAAEYKKKEAAARARDKERVAQAKKKEQEKPSRADDPDLQLAHTATALATKGTVKDGRVEAGPVKFGAAVNSTQVVQMRERMKGKNILQALGNVSESKLKGYAQGDTKLADLPDETKGALKELNRTFDPKLKMWARKDAVIALALHLERKKAGRKKEKKAAEPVAA